MQYTKSGSSSSDLAIWRKLRILHRAKGPNGLYAEMYNKGLTEKIIAYRKKSTL